MAAAVQLGMLSATHIAAALGQSLFCLVFVSVVFGSLVVATAVAMLLWSVAHGILALLDGSHRLAEQTMMELALRDSG